MFSYFLIISLCIPLSLLSISNSISCLIQRLTSGPSSQFRFHLLSNTGAGAVSLPFRKTETVAGTAQMLWPNAEVTPYQGEGKKKAVSECVFQTLVKAYFLLGVNMC